MKAINRIFQYLDNEGIRPSVFEKKAGLSNGYLATQLKRNADIGEGVLLKVIDNSLKINPTWLLTGKGDMLLEPQKEGGGGKTLIYKESPPEAGATAHKEVPQVKSPADQGLNPFGVPMELDQRPILEITPRDTKHNVLIADVAASAGLGVLIGEEDQKRLEELPSTYLPCAPYGLNIAFQIRGDSMYPTIRNLDYVVGNKIESLREIQNGHTYVIIDIDNEVYCKRIFSVGEEWEIVSDNLSYPPYRRHKSEFINFFKAFMRFSSDFQNTNNDVMKDINQLKADMEMVKRRLK